MPFCFLSRLLRKEMSVPPAGVLPASAEPPDEPSAREAEPTRLGVEPVELLVGTDVAHYFIYHPTDLAYWSDLPSDWIATDLPFERDLFSLGARGGWGTFQDPEAELL